MFTDAVLIGMGALDGKEFFAIEGLQKTGAQLRDNPEEREKWPPPHRRNTLAESVPVS